MTCPETSTGAPCEAVCARCGRDMHDELRELREQLDLARRSRDGRQAEVEDLREVLDGMAPAEGSWQAEALALRAELAQLRAELERFREVARDLLAWHDNGHVVLLQDHADKLRRLLDGEQP